MRLMTIAAILAHTVHAAALNELSEQQQQQQHTTTTDDKSYDANGK